MIPTTPSLESRCSHLLAQLRRAAHAPPPVLLAAALDGARDARQAGRADLAVPILERLVELDRNAAAAWQMLGFAYAEEQCMDAAVGAFERAATLDPREALTARAHAQARLDAGLPAADFFSRALRIAPDDLAAISGRAAALSAEGQRPAAESLLADTLQRHPDWLAGHKSLAALRWTAGDARQFAASYAAACAAQPRNLPLRLAWFSALAQARDWPAALAVVAEGEALIGACTAFTVARIFIAGESDDRAAAAQLFAQHAAIRDDVLTMAHLRYCLRTAQLEQAERLGQQLLRGPAAQASWPYLSLIWRALGDARAAWLDGAPPYIRVIDLDYSAAQLEQLAEVLRRLHTAQRPPVEQSVRGGTQTDTDRQLFFRTEPEIQRVRNTVRAAIQDYVAGMPAPVAGHPLLGPARGRILFSGSWSVRLNGQGFHVSHTHPMGWISSALYVSLPQPAQRGGAPAGWIRFGVPPAALGLTLPAYTQIEPKPGRLVLFPSTLWHQTLPFDDGERLVISFDVMRARHVAVTA